MLVRSPAGQEARQLLVAWDIALTPPLWVQAGDSSPRQAGPRALLSHCCAPSSTGRIHRISCESLVSQLLGVQKHGCLSSNPGDRPLSTGREEGTPHSHRSGFSHPALFWKPNKQGPATLEPLRAFPVAQLVLLPPLYGRTMQRSGNRMLNARWTGPLPTLVLTPSGPCFPKSPYKGKKQDLGNK